MENALYLMGGALSAMMTIVHKKLYPKGAEKASRAAAKRSVVEKRVQGPDGRYVTVLKLDADSKTFTDELSYLFERNVAKARRQNRKISAAAAHAEGGKRSSKIMDRRGS
jgi:hypothetical protein